jgi:hypothetical protein
MAKVHLKIFRLRLSKEGYLVHKPNTSYALHSGMSQNGTRAALLVLFLALLAVPVIALVPPGRIAVSSNPSGALACIDSSDCDITTATFRAEGNAWHTVIITQKGYRSWVEKVYVTSEQTSVVNANLDLDPAATAIRVYVTPSSGTICLDNSQCREIGRLAGSTESTLFTGVSPGYHTVSVKAPSGYRDATELVQVEVGKITDTSITLKPDTVLITPSGPGTGAIRVYVDRTGSTICLDDADCFRDVSRNPGPGTSTALFNDVTADRIHIVTVTTDGYRPDSTEVSVSKDRISTVEIKLRPLATVTTTLPTLTQAETTTLPTRAGLDTIPVIGALALYGAVLLFRGERL